MSGVLLAVYVFATITIHAQYASAVAPADGLIGYWSTNGGAILRIGSCSTFTCITVVTISRKAPGVVDGRNPDLAMRSRPICQMDVGTGIHLRYPVDADGGRSYDPESGKTYKAAMDSDGNTLTLRGYIGFKALGRTQTWTRTSAESATCVGTTHR